MPPLSSLSFIDFHDRSLGICVSLQVFVIRLWSGWQLSWWPEIASRYWGQKLSTGII